VRYVGLQVRLAVAGAFHTKYMAPAAEKLQEALNNTTIVTPRIPVISNVDAQPHSDPATIKAILAKQVGLREWVRGADLAGWGCLVHRLECVHCCCRCVLMGAGWRDVYAGTTNCPLSYALLLHVSLLCSGLLSQLTSPVQWETTLQTLLEKGLQKSYEVGPGKVIAGIMKRIDKKAEITNVIA
jgi:malonyl CoA-acyl carrier protein transacylase